MDEWQLEMAEMGRRLGELKAHDGDPVIIDELEAELRILNSFYTTSLDVFEAGQRDLAAQAGLVAERWGKWTLRNVYSFVYEKAMELEPGRRELSSLVPEQDYIGMLREAAA
ncbi:MAG TPA: hypothetical protein VIN56_11590 [Candidatus Dormibacteraeota bacterium]|jgi:hypothetical protein